MFSRQRDSLVAMIATILEGALKANDAVYTKYLSENKAYASD